MKDITEKEIAECYQPLFDLMTSAYNLTLLIGEMDDIIHACQLVEVNVKKLVNS